MTERSKPQEAKQNPPFVIRGHHLFEYASFIKYEGYKNPKLYSKWVTEGLKKRRELAQTLANGGTIEEKYVDMLKDPVKEVEYLNDILGMPYENGSAYEKNYAQLMTTFRDMPDDTTVKLIAGKPDNLCATCPAIGEHCRLKDNRKFNGSKDVPSGDNGFIKIFIAESRKILKEKDLKTHTEIADFIDASPQKVTSYELKAGNFKTVLGTIAKDVSLYNSIENYQSFSSQRI